MTASSAAARALSPVVPSPVAPTSRADGRTAAPGAPEAQGELGFEDLIDAVNPLHHLPGVSMVYGAATGDRIGLPAKLAGGFLFGGPMGLLGSVAMAVFEEVSGDSIGGHLAGLVGVDAAAGTGGATGSGPVASPGEAPRPASAASLTEALRRQAGPAGPGSAPAPAAPPLAVDHSLRPDATTLARLYALEAVRPGADQASARS